MHMMLMVVDGTALMLGSLTAAVLLTSLAWWMGGRLHRRWVSLPLMAAGLLALLVSPMEQSLFVRMMTVFGAVGAAVLCFAVLEEGVARPGRAPAPWSRR